ncbi:MAG: hypothetical protein QW767_03725 [Thermoprotei archaeon]
MSEHTSDQYVTQKSGRVAGFFSKIKAMLKGFLNALLGRKSTPKQSSEGGTGTVHTVGLGTVQSMAASPATVQSTTSYSATVGETSNQTLTTEPAYSYQRPKESPPLPTEHKAIVKKHVRSGNRRRAEEELARLGYISPEVSTRGGTVVVKYKGADGTPFMAKFRYK